MTAAVFDHLLLGAGTVFDARRRPMATRLTLHPLHAEHSPDATTLVAALQEVWPETAGALWLNLTSEASLKGLVQQTLPRHVFVEVPAFLAGDPSWRPLWTSDRTARASRVLKGRPLTPLDPAVIGAFAQAIVDRPDDRRLGDQVLADAPPRQLPFVQTGNTCAFEVADSFRRGAQGVVGWPLGDPPDEHTAKREIPAGVGVVMDLMQRIERDEDPDELERVLRRAPALAYRLMRFINSPAFGLSVEINSFQHALMVLGTKRLKRWLALLVTGAVEDPELKPLMFLAVRRGLLMEELVRSQGDEGLRNEAFICGVFSLLDRMLGQPFDKLLESLPVPGRVADALASASGPLRPWLDLAVAVEMESPFDIQEATDTLMLAPGDVNRAVLISLRAAWQMREE